MERVTFRIPEDQVTEIEALVEDGTFPNRSETIRTGIRELLEEYEDDQQPGVLYLASQSSTLDSTYP